MWKRRIQNHRVAQANNAATAELIEKPNIKPTIESLSIPNKPVAFRSRARIFWLICELQGMLRSFRANSLG